MSRSPDAVHLNPIKNFTMTITYYLNTSITNLEAVFRLIDIDTNDASRIRKAASSKHNKNQLAHCKAPIAYASFAGREKGYHSAKTFLNGLYMYVRCSDPSMNAKSKKHQYYHVKLFKSSISIIGLKSEAMGRHIADKVVRKLNHINTILRQKSDDLLFAYAQAYGENTINSTAAFHRMQEAIGLADPFAAYMMRFPILQEEDVAELLEIDSIADEAIEISEMKYGMCNIFYSLREQRPLSEIARLVSENNVHGANAPIIGTGLVIKADLWKDEKPVTYRVHGRCSVKQSTRTLDQAYEAYSYFDKLLDPQ